jgi:hypothetical protein
MLPMTLKSCLIAATAAVLMILTAVPLMAEVRLGKNVRIGGHDASNQTFNSKRRGEYYIYNGRPAREGCRWRNNGDGSRTKVCHLRRKIR